MLTSLIPVLLIALVSAFLLTELFRQHRKANRLRNLQWTDLIVRLRPVPRAGVRAIAEAYLHPKSSQIAREPEEIFELLGRGDGLNAMFMNATVILQLAGYATRWNPVEAAVVAEMIRQDARRLQQAIRGVERELWRKRIARRAPFRLLEAAAAYHLMTSRLLVLYETSHSGLYPRLAEVL
jgi:hypothetical protein